MKTAKLVCTLNSLYNSAVAAAIFATGVREIIVSHPDNVAMERVPRAPNGQLWRACLLCGIEYLPSTTTDASETEYSRQVARILDEAERSLARKQIEEEQCLAIVIRHFDSPADKVELASEADVFKVIVGAAHTTHEVDALIATFLEVCRERFREMVRPPVQDARRGHILYVEDDALVRGLLRGSLEADGWLLDVCAEGQSAWEKIAGTAHYDLLLLDHELPGKSGIELVNEARLLAHRARTPIIMLSGANVEAEARRAGVDIFLRKPDGALSVGHIIDRLLSKRDATHEEFARVM